MDNQPRVYIVDPDAASREAVRKVAEDMELPCEEHESGWSFLDSYDHSRPGCVVLSLRIPDIGGLQIQNAGTLCGNVCNASPAADGVPNLLALDARVERQQVPAEALFH